MTLGDIRKKIDDCPSFELLESLPTDEELEECLTAFWKETCRRNPAWEEALVDLFEVR